MEGDAAGGLIEIKGARYGQKNPAGWESCGVQLNTIITGTRLALRRLPENATNCRRAANTAVTFKIQPATP
ncbi:MAG TPA: hypothetical protein VFX11_19160 [Candidatus Kapabacteria bacterium]|nr:hypothetical protein [Candidatus Kapabacteria bacterium]